MILESSGKHELSVILKSWVYIADVGGTRSYQEFLWFYRALKLLLSVIFGKSVRDNNPSPLVFDLKLITICVKHEIIGNTVNSGAPLQYCLTFKMSIRCPHQTKPHVHRAGIKLGQFEDLWNRTQNLSFYPTKAA